ncbi:MAG: thiamine diphosphokinase [Chloroflexi bacterium]|nr:thiamine diphosphokinase [Chloroflexota bacterium]
MPRCLVFVNGHLPDREAARSLLRPDDFIIAADGGTRHILTLGLLPQIVIGDLDSLAESDRRRLEQAGVLLRRYPADKDETDLELALKYAVEANYRPIIIVAALGGRLDQTLGNLSMLADPALAGLDVRLDDGVEQAFFVRRQAQIRGRLGDVVSLIPWGVPAVGVTTEGLRWPLSGETLSPHKTRGISNELLSDTATIRIEEGLLLCVHRREGCRKVE